MPNPEFTGTVPHRRCETCLYWVRSDVGNGLHVWGECRYGLNVVNGTSGRNTTDLAVCSNWEVLHPADASGS